MAPRAQRLGRANHTNSEKRTRVFLHAKHALQVEKRRTAHGAAIDFGQAVNVASSAAMTIGSAADANTTAQLKPCT